MEIFIKIGECAAGNDGDQLRTVLGSCIGLCLWDESRRVGGMAHVMLPRNREGQVNGEPGKYGDTAVEALSGLLKKRGAERLKAKLAGGASMFFTGGHAEDVMAVGLQNHRTVVEHLRTAGIPVVFEHIGGHKGRNIVFDCGTGELTIREQEGRTVRG